jgi:hypothetical protein
VVGNDSSFVILCRAAFIRTVTMQIPNACGIAYHCCSQRHKRCIAMPAELLPRRHHGETATACDEFRVRSFGVCLPLPWCQKNRKPTQGRSRTIMSEKRQCTESHDTDGDRRVHMFGNDAKQCFDSSRSSDLVTTELYRAPNQNRLEPLQDSKTYHRSPYCARIVHTPATRMLILSAPMQRT